MESNLVISIWRVKLVCFCTFGKLWSLPEAGTKRKHLHCWFTTRWIKCASTDLKNSITKKVYILTKKVIIGKANCSKRRKGHLKLGHDFTESGITLFPYEYFRAREENTTLSIPFQDCYWLELGEIKAQIPLLSIETSIEFLSIEGPEWAAWSLPSIRDITVSFSCEC